MPGGVISEVIIQSLLWHHSDGNQDPFSPNDSSACRCHAMMYGCASLAAPRPRRILSNLHVHALRIGK